MILALLITLLLPQALVDALEAYDDGRYPEACAQLDGLTRAEGFDVEARLKTAKYLGACRYFEGQRPKAQAAFQRLLEMDPSARLDPVTFPPDMLGFFEGLKAEHQAKLKAKREAEAKKQLKPARTPSMDELDADLKREVSPEELLQEELDPRRPNLRTYGPFGLGQFQNAQDTRGYTLAGLQIGALGFGVYNLLMFEAEKTSGGFLAGGEFEDEAKAQTLQTLYLVGFGAFAGLWAYGVYDALQFYERPVALHPTPDGLLLSTIF